MNPCRYTSGMSKPSAARYRTTNWSSYNVSLRKRGSLLIWVDKDMTWRAPRDGRTGRPTAFSDAAVQFCLSIKILFKLPLRQTAGMVASLLRLAGLDWPVPDFSILCRRQKTLAVQIPYRRADGPLNLLVDSTGIKFLGDGEWQARKHGVQGRRQWRKVHLAMDPATSDIRAVEFTPSRDGDSPVLPDLLGQIPEDELIGTVTADGAYDTRRCHKAIIDRQATPIIPIRRNGRLNQWRRNGSPSRSTAQRYPVFVLPRLPMGAPLVRAPVATVQHRRRGLVHVEPGAAGLQQHRHALDDGRDQRAGSAHPVGQHRAVDRHPVPGHGHRLPVQRHVPGMLGHGDLGEQR